MDANIKIYLIVKFKVRAARICQMIYRPQVVRTQYSQLEGLALSNNAVGKQIPRGHYAFTNIIPFLIVSTMYMKKQSISTIKQG